MRIRYFRFYSVFFDVHFRPCIRNLHIKKYVGMLQHPSHQIIDMIPRVPNQEVVLLTESGGNLLPKVDGRLNLG